MLLAIIKTSIMNTKTYFRLTILALSTLFISCEKTDHYGTASSTLVYTELTTNKTVAAVLGTATGTAKEYTSDDVIEAYVSSSDETGSFYNSISFQTLPTATQGPMGFSVSLTLKSFQYGFTPGRKVYIKLKGLYYSTSYGSVVFGASYNGAVGRLAEWDWNKYLFISETKVAEDQLATTMTLDQATANSNLTYDPNINTLIDLTNVRFADTSLDRNYFDVDSGGGATNHNIVDNTGGNTEFFRVSSYASFAYKPVSWGTGVIRSVLSKYRTDYQFVPRFLTDVRLSNPRNYNYVTTLNENFESYTSKQYCFSNYLNLVTDGKKNWLINSATGSTNKFIEMSAYQSNGAAEIDKAYFMVPVNFDAANTISFQSRVQFYQSAVLKVYLATEYKPGDSVTDTKLIDVTSFFTIPTVSQGNPPFTPSGTYTIPTNIKSNGFLVFHYSGNSFLTGPSNTTTMQIDNIVIQ
ncbi:MAG: hypothetical protein CFE24_11220 [Flavobacterium sp. BFFFF2]|nr:MAG: hypothetical protein CFE24_11220 [Flavobacterium sp. BFFFF2]